MNSKQESTFAIIKPESIEKKLVGTIIKMIESANLEIAQMKMIKADESVVSKHYYKDDAWCEKVGKNVMESYLKHNKDPKSELGTDDPVAVGRLLLKWVIDHMTSSEIVIMELRGEDAVDKFRVLCGKTTPADAGPDTIRGMLSNDDNDTAALEQRPLLNLLHSSGNKEEADQELKLWFS